MTQEHSTLLLASAVVSFAGATLAVDLSVPVTYLLNGGALMETRRRALAGDPTLTAGLRELHRRVDRHLTHTLWSVTDKPFAGPSGDKHDYVSLASYFWPDTNSPAGLPYVSRDGVLNPETRDYDRTRLDGMCDAVYTLSLASYLTGDEAYGLRAVSQLRTWFLDSATRMNPHLTNAQMVKGKNEGNPWGLIETEHLTQVIDAVEVLRAGGLWPDEDHRRLQQWFADYLTWLRTSDLGKREAAAPNNHGTLYDVQTTVFALFLGQTDLARTILEDAKTRRIATQIEPDGAQPRELRRTKSWSYTLLNLTGMVHLAQLGELVGVDLWNYRTPDGRSIRAALDWVVPYVSGKTWDRQQITRQAYEPLVWLLRKAAAAYHEPAYEEAIARMPGVERERLWVDLLDPKAPAISHRSTERVLPSVVQLGGTAASPSAGSKAAVPPEEATQSTRTP